MLFTALLLLYNSKSHVNFCCCCRWQKLMARLFSQRVKFSPETLSWSPNLLYPEIPYLKKSKHLFFALSRVSRRIFFSWVDSGRLCRRLRRFFVASWAWRRCVDTRRDPKTRRAARREPRSRSTEPRPRSENLTSSKKGSIRIKRRSPCSRFQEESIQVLRRDHQGLPQWFST